MTAQAPPSPEQLPLRTISAVAVGSLVLFALAIVWSTDILRRQTLVPSAPVTEAGMDEIGLVDQTQFELEGRTAALQREQRRKLASYGWVDRDAGVIHIPISRAMDELVTEGRGR